MKRTIAYFLGLVIFLSLITVTMGEEETQEQHLAQQQATQLRDQEQKQLILQQRAQLYYVQELEFEQQQRNQQALAQRSAGAALAPDMYLFGGYYYPDRNADDYSRRGYESRRYEYDHRDRYGR